MDRDWTGREATALRQALRLTTDEFAKRLGVAPRSITNWAAAPDMRPRAAQQDKLGSLLERASLAARARFDDLIAGAAAPPVAGAQMLRVAIAVVIERENVLLVRRRAAEGPLSWQFPAGIVKPHEEPDDVAVRETLAETGIHCVTREHIGTRLHPVTAVDCVYYLCDYLGGTAENRDVAENAGVVWAPLGNVTRYVPRETIYPPILAMLEAPNDRAVSQ